MKFHGGSVIHHPEIYAIFAGPNWRTDKSDVRNADTQLLHDLPHSDFQNALSCYRDASGNIQLDPVVKATVTESSWTPPRDAQDGDYIAGLQRLIRQHGWRNSKNAIFLVFPQRGTYREGQAKGCGWHNYLGNIVFGVVIHPGDDSGCLTTGIPDHYETELGVSGPEWSDVAAGGMYYTAHEYAEADADPHPYTGYVEDSGLYGGEVADQCVENWGAWFDGRNDSFASIWSPADGACTFGDQQTLGETITSQPSSPQNVALSLRGDGTPGEKLFIPNKVGAAVPTIVINSQSCQPDSWTLGPRIYSGFLCNMANDGRLTLRAQVQLGPGVTVNDAVAQLAGSVDIAFGDSVTPPLPLTVPKHIVTFNGTSLSGPVVNPAPLKAWEPSRPLPGYALSFPPAQGGSATTTSTTPPNATMAPMTMTTMLQMG